LRQDPATGAADRSEQKVADKRQVIRVFNEHADRHVSQDKQDICNGRFADEDQPADQPGVQQQRQPVIQPGQVTVRTVIIQLIRVEAN